MAAPLPTVTVQAQFTAGTWTDISTFAKTVDVIRPSTRLQGPLWQYQAATASILLDNSDGRFDPDNLAGPYTSSTGLQQVIWVCGPGQSKTWVAPRNLSGTTIKAECWGPGATGTAGPGTGGGGGEYAAEAAYAVIPGNSYAAVCPAGNSGLATTFNGTGVVANPATPNGTTPGSGSINSVHFNGGSGGAAGTGSPNSLGGGGGSSGGTTSAGGAGTAGNSGGAGGVPPAGGYAGGTGAPDARYRGQSGQGPGGGGGGGAESLPPSGGQVGRFSGSAAGMGTGGQVRLTYFVTITSASVMTQVLPMVPVRVTATWPANWLTLAGSGSTANSGFEGSIGTWVVNGNCTPSDTALQAHTGSNSMAMTSLAAGTMWAQHTGNGNYAMNGLPVRAGQKVFASCWFRAAATPETCNVGVNFYDAAGNNLGPGGGPGPPVTDTTTGWVQATDGGLMTAPANSAYAIAYTEVNSTAGASEVHYADDFTLGVFYPLFNGSADSWTETAVDYSAGYSEVTLAATDGFKQLAGNQLAALGSPLGAGEDSGTRASRILDSAGWPPSARAIDAGDTTQQGTSFGSDALSLLQLTADTEVGETYVNGSGNVVFRHRKAILSDTRSAYPQAVFGDQPGSSVAQVSWHGDGVAGGSPFFIGVGAAPVSSYFPGSTAASKQLWVWSSVTYAAGVQLVFSFYDNTLTFISAASGAVTATGPTPVLLPLTATSPSNTAFMNIQVQVQAVPAASVIFSAAAAPPIDGNDVTLVPGLTPWTGLFAQTTATTLANWVPLAGVPGELPYATVGRANDDTTLANDIQITAAGSANLQEATDPVSVYVYGGERSYARTDLLLQDDPTAFLYANWVLYVSRNSEDRFDTVQVDPLADTTDLYPQVLGREIGDRIQVWRTPAGVATRVHKDVFIRGIEHSFDSVSEAWLTTWTLQSAAKYSGFMTLDSASSGLLDVDALAY